MIFLYIRTTIDRFIPIPATIHRMQVAWRKFSKIGSAYLWSILLWGCFVPVMASQEKDRLSEAGLVYKRS
jgi:hypothetical protein